MRWVPSLTPRLRQIRAHGPRRATNLIHHRVLLLVGKCPRQFKDAHRRRKCILINSQIAITANVWHFILASPRGFSFPRHYSPRPFLTASPRHTVKVSPRRLSWHSPPPPVPLPAGFVPQISIRPFSKGRSRTAPAPPCLPRYSR